MVHHSKRIEQQETIACKKFLDSFKSTICFRRMLWHLYASSEEQGSGREEYFLRRTIYQSRCILYE
jgi:hypothetical protein